MVSRVGVGFALLEAPGFGAFGDFALDVGAAASALAEGSAVGASEGEGEGEGVASAACVGAGGAGGAASPCAELAVGEAAGGLSCAGFCERNSTSPPINAAAPSAAATTAVIRPPCVADRAGSEPASALPCASLDLTPGSVKLTAATLTAPEGGAGGCDNAAPAAAAAAAAT